MTESDNISNLRSNLQLAADVHKTDPHIRPSEAVREEYIDPVLSHTKTLKPEEQEKMVNLSAGLVPRYGETSPLTSFVPDPANKNISKSRILSKFFYNRSPTGYLQERSPPNKAMEEGTKQHEEIKNVIPNLERAGFKPMPTMRKAVQLPLFGGLGIINYSTTDDNPQTRPISNVMNLMNDFQSINQEQKKYASGSAEKFGLEPHLGAAGQPVPYRFSGAYDMLMEGRPGTAYAGKRIMVDFKSTQSKDDPAPMVMKNAIMYSTEAAFYRFLFGNAGVKADYYANFYTQPGRLSIYPEAELERLKNNEMKGFIQTLHKEQSPWRSLLDFLTEESSLKGMRKGV